MNFELNPEQSLLRESVTGYLARHYDFASRRAALANGGWRPEIWRGMAEDLGLFGAALPEAAGGLGGGPVETMIILEAFGRALVLEPYLEWVTLTAALLSRSDEPVADLVNGIVEGSHRIAPALYEDGGRFNLASVATRCRQTGTGWSVSGAKLAVTGAAGATHLIVSARAEGADRDRDGIALLLVAIGADGLTRRDYALIDGHRAADFEFTETPARLIDLSSETLANIERAVDEAIVATCAEAIGVMQVALDQTVAYAGQREQFGQPIARFQVLQHRMADMRTRIELSRSMTVMATLSLDLPTAERRKAVSAAKALVSDAAKFVAQGAVQIHGGIGTTDDLAISHYFKRATVISSRFGTAANHLKRMGQAAAAKGPATE